MRVLVLQRSIEPPGGGNAVAAWMLQALAGHHAVATLTERRWDAERVDSFYGTRLQDLPIEQHHNSAALRVLGLVPGRLEHLRMAALCRTSTRLRDRFDVVVTADNFAPFGRRGVQYLHHPVATGDRTGSPASAGYYALCRLIAPAPMESVRANVTLANSHWTARALAAEHGVDAQVLYPPVVDPGAGLPWEERSNSFLCVGRFNGSKRFEVAASIVARVRAFLPDARLHIVGSNVDREYTRRLRALERRFEWVTVQEDLPQVDLFALMRRSRYGIHAMIGEHFGLAVAEMARAGCVVFVHDSGGQVEAVGNAPELRWSGEDDAIGRIRDVAANASLQRRLSEEVAAAARHFSVENFMRQFREVIESFA